jgi:hypothetical protein
MLTHTWAQANAADRRKRCIDVDRTKTDCGPGERDLCGPASCCRVHITRQSAHTGEKYPVPRITHWEDSFGFRAEGVRKLSVSTISTMICTSSLRAIQSGRVGDEGLVGGPSV